MTTWIPFSVVWRLFKSRVHHALKDLVENDIDRACVSSALQFIEEADRKVSNYSDICIKVEPRSTSAITEVYKNKDWYSAKYWCLLYRHTKKDKYNLGYLHDAAYLTWEELISCLTEVENLDTVDPVRFIIIIAYNTLRAKEVAIYVHASENEVFGSECVKAMLRVQSTEISDKYIPGFAKCFI